MGHPGGSVLEAALGQFTWTLASVEMWGKEFGYKNTKPKQEIHRMLPELTPVSDFSLLVRKPSISQKEPEDEEFSNNK